MDVGQPGPLGIPPEASEAKDDSPSQSERNGTLAVISRRIVGLLKEYYGKGPTTARTYQWDDLVVVLMRGGYTTVEKTLVEEGRSEAVMSQRSEFQDVMRPRFKRVIEEELRREVVAFMSTNHHGPDLNAELFVLGPSTDLR